MYKIENEDIAPYCSKEDAIVQQALGILKNRLQNFDAMDSLSNPANVRNYLKLRFAGVEHEVFTVLFLDVKNRLIACEELFRGTLTQASVYPREVVKAALRTNAAGVILTHNHPSGDSQPSPADHKLTETLKQALGLVDVRVLDHFVVAADSVYSFAEHGNI